MLISYSVAAQEGRLLRPCCHLSLAFSQRIHVLCWLPAHAQVSRELQKLTDPEVAYLHPIAAKLLHQTQSLKHHTACQLTISC